jgi:xylulose-5-phosphate/fructose-6-phosphate phosphoketolase
MDALDRIPRLANKIGTARDRLRNQQLAAANWAFEHGIDPEDLGKWTWTRDPKTKKKAGDS